ncbi:hypothetical protein [Pseudomonas viridiflava]|uniref:hypothetical protein n=1 Tax=Pseudomonas viridiflava TaxID=33069 RepID=UPI0013E0CB40|nr:hypothetical protein [Pseudomonas viridiflava]
MIKNSDDSVQAPEAHSKGQVCSPAREFLTPLKLPAPLRLMIVTINYRNSLNLSSDDSVGGDEERIRSLSESASEGARLMLPLHHSFG